MSSQQQQQHNDDIAIPDEFVCPITQEVFHDPVMDSSGRSFERNAILTWLCDHGTCPMTREPRRAFNYIPNPTMNAKVRVWMKQNGLDYENNDIVYKSSSQSEPQQLVLTLKPGFNEMDSSNHTETTSSSVSGHDDEEEQEDRQQAPTETSTRRRNNRNGRRFLQIFRRSTTAVRR